TIHRQAAIQLVECRCRTAREPPTPETMPLLRPCRILRVGLLHEDAPRHARDAGISVDAPFPFAGAPLPTGPSSAPCDAPLAAFVAPPSNVVTVVSVPRCVPPANPPSCFASARVGSANSVMKPLASAWSYSSPLAKLASCSSY